MWQFIAGVQTIIAGVQMTLCEKSGQTECSLWHSGARVAWVLAINCWCADKPVSKQWTDGVLAVAFRCEGCLGFGSLSLVCRQTCVERVDRQSANCGVQDALFLAISCFQDNSVSRDLMGVCYFLLQRALWCLLCSSMVLIERAHHNFHLIQVCDQCKGTGTRLTIKLF